MIIEEMYGENFSINYLAELDLNDFRHGSVLRYIKIEEEINGVVYDVHFLHDIEGRNFYLSKIGYKYSSET